MAMASSTEPPGEWMTSVSTRGPGRSSAWRSASAVPGSIRPSAVSCPSPALHEAHRLGHRGPVDRPVEARQNRLSPIRSDGHRARQIGTDLIARHGTGQRHRPGARAPLLGQAGEREIAIVESEHADRHGEKRGEDQRSTVPSGMRRMRRSKRPGAASLSVMARRPARAYREAVFGKGATGSLRCTMFGAGPADDDLARLLVVPGAGSGLRQAQPLADPQRAHQVGRAHLGLAHLLAVLAANHLLDDAEDEDEDAGTRSIAMAPAQDGRKSRA